MECSKGLLLIYDQRLNDTHGFRHFYLPHTTAIGFENKDIKGWIERVMKDKTQSSIPLTVISSNISAATYLATVCLTLSSLIGTWIESNATVFQSTLIYGDTRSSTMTLKYVSLLDGATFVVDVAVATLSQTVKHWLDEENNTDKVITFPNVTSTIFVMVIEWDAKFANVVHTVMCDLLFVANYMDIKGLVDLFCQSTADMMKDKDSRRGSKNLQHRE